ncbi:hypothetical protein ACJZ2D_014118 [Fusarium nematophilum]
MWRLMRVPARAAATPAARQARFFAAQTSAHASSSGKPAETTVKHERQPTESEEDVAADRSRIDPIHRKNATDSQQDVEADRSPVDPLKGPSK